MSKAQVFMPERIKELRESKDMTQENFTIAMHNFGLKKTRATFIQWENGTTFPTAPQLAQLAAFYKVPIQTFYK